MKDNKYTILYIDDEEVNLRLFKNSFRRDFDILIASSAREGLEILKNNTIDVVITDQRMPEITGVEFLKIVNERYPDIPPNRLILSGYSDADQIEKAFNEYRLYRFVSKPWNVDELKIIILEAINQK